MKKIYYAMYILSNFICIPLFAVEIPINIGVGPSYYLLPEKLQENNEAFYGLHLQISAIINKKVIEKQKIRSLPNTVTL